MRELRESGKRGYGDGSGVDERPASGLGALVLLVNVVGEDGTIAETEQHRGKFCE